MSLAIIKYILNEITFDYYFRRRFFFLISLTRNIMRLKSIRSLPQISERAFVAFLILSRVEDKLKFAFNE